MSDQLKLINLDATWRRLLLVIPVALALTGLWFVARWSLGNTFAVYPPDAETVRAAERLAPDDPQVHFTLAVLAKKSFSPGELEESLRRYERAAGLSPNDYRLWMELGRVRGQAGDAAGGERALRRAAELAPHYALPRWYLGNLLLRAGRTDEAFATLREAARFDPGLQPQIIALAWNVYGGEIGRVAAAVGNTVAARAQLAEHLVKQNRIDDALRVWSSLENAGQQEQHAAGERLMGALFAVKRFHAGLDVYRDIAPGAAEGPSVGRVTNGDFEGEVGVGGKQPFNWNVRPVAQAQMGIDPR
ncbi:MAG: tetratricopeptide repeat protein, partial [Pyrinomonadaceae bacterium]